MIFISINDILGKKRGVMREREDEDLCATSVLHVIGGLKKVIRVLYGQRREVNASRGKKFSHFLSLQGESV